MDLDLRKLRYFAAVADELHFGHAAERLHIAQPVLSRQIRELERELDATLFTRTNKRVQLTDAGRQLLDDARPLLAFSQAALRRVRRAHAALLSLTIGFAAGVRIAPVVQALEARHPDVQIELRQIPWQEQAETLRDGTFDVGFVRRPIDEEGLTLIPFLSEPRLALLSIHHPLAEMQSLSIAQLSDDPVVVHRAPAPAFTFANIKPRPDGRTQRQGPVAATMEEKLEHVAAGHAIAFAPASVAMTYAHPGIVCIPVTDISPSEVCIARRSGVSSPLIDEFIELAKSINRQTSPTLD